MLGMHCDRLGSRLALGLFALILFSSFLSSFHYGTICVTRYLLLISHCGVAICLATQAVDIFYRGYAIAHSYAIAHNRHVQSVL